MTDAEIARAFHLAAAHLAAGRAAEAEALGRRILREHPEHPVAIHLLGIAALQADRLAEALDYIGRAIALRPNDPEILHNFSLVLARLGRLADAESVCCRAIELRPNWPEALRTLASHLRQQQCRDQAVQILREVVRLAPGYCRGQLDLGVVLLELLRLDEAIGPLQVALRLEPANPMVHHNLGLWHERKNQLADAERCYRKAVELAPAAPQPRMNLGMLLRERSNIDEAIATLRDAAMLSPDATWTYAGLGMALLDAGQLDEALEMLAIPAGLSQSPAAFSAKPVFGESLKGEPHKVHSTYVMALNYTSLPPAEIFAAHQRWASAHTANIPPLTLSINPQPNRPLRIGYVSPDLHNHPAARFLEPLFACRDRAAIQTIVFNDTLILDSITQRLRAQVDQWLDTAGLTDEQFAQTVAEQRIDILVDLAGHTGHNRLLAFARKPAPIQITWLGYPTTTGMSQIDYRLTDAIADPPGSTEQFHTEKLLRLPCGFACFTPHPLAPGVSPLPADSSGVITFGILHKLAKLNPAVLDLWAQIAAAVPKSRFLVYRNTLTGSVRQWVLQQFTIRGVDALRIMLEPCPLRFKTHLELYGRIDVALDAFPWTGHTTTCEALHQGVPTITLSGPCHAHRMSASALTHAGFPELIAASPQDYLRIATELSGDIPRLRELRRTLRDRMRASALMEGKRFTRSLEECYRSVWKQISEIP